MKYYLAIDIGASSGRHIVGWYEGGEIKTDETYRFANGMDELDGHLVWDTDRLLREVIAGVRKSFEKYPKIESLSIDTWGVDYVLMRGDEEIKPTYAYRDSRTDAAIDAVHSIISFEELYERTGIQFSKFNTVYQLYADKLAGRLDGATDFLMIPEYLMYKLTGKKVKEYTDATTGALVSVKDAKFDKYIFDKLSLPEALIAPLNLPGTAVGELLPSIQREVGGSLTVVLCATHDTASAVEAIEMTENSPYISSGTWSLLGVKTDRAITDAGSRASGYSNEGGVGYNRYQKNITGMWIVQSLRAELCPDTSYGDIVLMAKKSDYTELIDVNDDAFTAPKSMKGAIDGYLKAQGKPLPTCDADYFNCAYVSLADGYRVAIADLEANTGRSYPDVYIVGGGAKNGYLNGLTEMATGKHVVPLPIEATAIGNLTVQIRRKI
ncbi:MAG: rhamnulokinase [Clostridia bacterium]|nr:rhamnulokinase [Clostridia bacterium]